MNSEGNLSIWLGTCDSIKELQEYLQVFYTEEGDFIDSQFEKEFGIAHFDEDFREINFLEKPSSSFSDIVKGHSYFESIASNFIEAFTDDLDQEYNSIILLYDFAYGGSKKESKSRNRFIKFIGTTQYNKK